MNRLLILFCSLPLFACGQSSKFPTKTDLTKIYTQATADFIKHAHKKNKTAFDKLFFGKRKTDNQTTFPI